jgi:hypothetical protein
MNVIRPEPNLLTITIVQTIQYFLSLLVVADAADYDANQSKIFPVFAHNCKKATFSKTSCRAVVLSGP